MKVSEFPDCCGMIVLSGFGNNTTAIDKTPYKLEEISAFLDAQTSRWSQKAMLTATINSEQYKLMRGLFKEKGWKLVAKNIHRAHAHKIYVYIKKLV